MLAAMDAERGGAARRAQHRVPPPCQEGGCGGRQLRRRRGVNARRLWSSRADAHGARRPRARPALQARRRRRRRRRGMPKHIKGHSSGRLRVADALGVASPRLGPGLRRASDHLVARAAAGRRRHGHRARAPATRPSSATGKLTRQATNTPSLPLEAPRHMLGGISKMFCFFQNCARNQASKRHKLQLSGAEAQTSVDARFGRR